jgi:hypothetical protein
MPVVVIADAAQTVIGPDEATARVVIVIGIIGRIVIAATDEVPVVVGEAEAAAVMETAAMKCPTAVKTTSVHTPAVEAPYVHAAAVEASTAMETSATHMTASAHVAAAPAHVATTAAHVATTAATRPADFGDQAA